MHGRGGGPPWGGPPQHGGWNDDEEDFDEMEMGRPDMRHHGGPPGDLGGPSGDMGMPGSEKPNPLGIDLSGEVWVETKTEEGKSYFYNARTRETTWSRPEETPGVRILSQNQVEELTQQLAGNENKKGPEDGPQFGGMPPASYMPPPGKKRIIFHKETHQFKYQNGETQKGLSNRGFSLVIRTSLVFLHLLNHGKSYLLFRSWLKYLASK